MTQTALNQRLALLAELRHATAADHRSAESAVSLADLTNHLDAYTRWLDIQHRWHQRMWDTLVALDPGEGALASPDDVAAVGRRVDWLAADRDELRGAAVETCRPIPIDETHSWLPAATWAGPAEGWRVGVLYVVLGSGMGAQIIRRTIQKSGHAHWASRFLDGVSQPGELARWRAFVAGAEATQPEPIVRSAIAGAHWAFEQFSILQVLPKHAEQANPTTPAVQR